MKLVVGLAHLVAAAVLSGPAARADDVAEFYRGRTITLVAGFNVGGGADAYARIIARHLGAHISGGPAVVVKNMQGAGSVLAANHIYNVSPKDGSEIGLFAGNIVVDPVIGGVPAKYDARKLNWIGAPASETSVCLASPASVFKTIDDTFKTEMVTGTAGTATYDFPVVLNNVLGTRLKLVKGYAGSAALRLAMERGEIDGFCGVGLSSMRSAGLADGKANILLQIALKKNPLLADVPFVMDYAKRAEDRQILRLVFGWADLERPLAAPPGTPPERRLRRGDAGSGLAGRGRARLAEHRADGSSRDRELHRRRLSDTAGGRRQGGPVARTWCAIAARAGPSIGANHGSG
jgi:tripartite-type tricarboxylate transporter receptor subunit TctC